ncbi:MAG: KEOPS complex subunit Pcc1 [Thermoplasmataceae archaeon]|jgi:tRNA threonylcarbamoyladenosine modification (KEOPS) complex  Pcc1 subunit
MANAQSSLQIKIILEKEKYSDYIQAIRPDLDTHVGRSRTWLEEDSESFYIYIRSPDTVALRAALGSISRWFKVVREVMEVVS